MNSKPFIKKFTGVDYDIWKMSLKALLTIHRVSHVLHDFNRPTKKTDAAVVEQWEKNNEKAFTYTVLVLDNAHRHKVICSTGFDIFSVLFNA